MFTRTCVQVEEADASAMDLVARLKAIAGREDLEPRHYSNRNSNSNRNRYSNSNSNGNSKSGRSRAARRPESAV